MKYLHLLYLLKRGLGAFSEGGRFLVNDQETVKDPLSQGPTSRKQCPK
ncbi:hypothetical protein [Paenibacillus agricola]|uniref:Uncharacterized protein n=1 Tax=Paenibacillus agricola TaxID=2716264 RepID=A0ABX0J665_9BACL|nr:hypothetical protein [Paenibacillus agricola]NHN31835.1 hypothetical protein [Paenibacillus agricola]